MKEINREDLFYKIQSVSFAMEDVRLYLDTHPDDIAAYEYYEAYKKIRAKSVSQYNRFFDPLDAYNLKREEYWSWYTKPWPWEGEN